MKSVLISIKPKYCEFIANGSKTIEVRKTRPRIETPFKCYIYCTKDKWQHLVKMPDKTYRIYDGKDYGNYNKSLHFEDESNGKVIGEFICDGITKLYNIATDKWDYLSGNAHENEKKLCTLGARLTESEVHSYACGKFLYAWHISDRVIYDKPKELHNFHNCSRCKIKYDCDVADWNCYEPLKRPPQSWCYVEGATNNE